MSAAAPNAGRAWSNDDVARLKLLLANHTPPALIALKLGRSRGAVAAKIAALGLPVAPAGAAEGAPHGA